MLERAYVDAVADRAALAALAGGRQAPVRRRRWGRRRAEALAAPPAATLVLEHALLEVVAGQEAAFEAAFAEAKAIISSAGGFRSLRLERCLERPNRYLLLVEWERLEDHTEGFRGSEAYQAWKGLLHRFYDPFPVVEHYEPVAVAVP